MFGLRNLSRKFFTGKSTVTIASLRLKSSENVRNPTALFPARSWLFSSKTQKGFVNAGQSKADVIVLDLEDSVPQKLKSQMIHEYFSALRSGTFQEKRVFVRLCELENKEELIKQIEVLTMPNVYGFMLPKIKSSLCLREYERLVTKAEKNIFPPGSIKFVPILETADAFFNAEQIATGSKRNVGIIAGAADFMADSNCEEDSSAYDAFHSQVVLAATNAHIQAIAGVCHKIDDHVATEKFYRKMKASGYNGVATLTPLQSIQANIVFSYSSKELKWAEHVSSLDHRISMIQPSIHESRRMIGPPHKLIASKIVQENQIIQGMSSAAKNKPRIFARQIPSRGLRETVHVGHTFRSPLEVTMTESWKALWESAFFTVNRLETSNEFASKLGLKSAPLPFTLVNTLALALSVTSFSETARVHLGCYNALQKKPVFVGDTLQCVYRVDDAKAIEVNGGNQYTVVYSTHHLVNQLKENVFTVQKRTMFSSLKLDQDCEQDSNLNSIPKDDKISSWRQFITSQPTTVLSNDVTHAPPSLTMGELIIHNDYKCFGLSETRMLCKLFKITNAHHHNIVRYSSSDILVPGPFAISAMISNTENDLGEVLYQEYPMHTNINKVNFGDQLGTLTFVKAIRPIEANPEMEEITLKHIGVKNVDLEWLLSEPGVPVDLFGDELEKPAMYEEVCAAQCPLLYRKIACQAVRKIIRVRPDVYNRQKMQ